MLSVTIKPFMISVIILSVIMLSLVAPLLYPHLLYSILQEERFFPQSDFPFFFCHQGHFIFYNTFNYFNADVL